ncbi:glycosyltransferase family 4 protein [Cellulomonas rhizosphaerae]|uniref:glycosyltransferase family 4 protein n=1 Tax=Cellulomonas rhizosphaerae TaxID=2293719 RepID=UPI001313D9AF|nr:glycosyltransferase family 4 protein [Cellulomonas rhizosphaerae]
MTGADEKYDVAYLTRYVGKTDTGIAFTDHAYLDGLARSAYSTLVVGNGIAPIYPADGLAYTTSAAEYRRHAPRLHLVNGMGSFVTHLPSGYRREHRRGHKVAIMHEEPTAFDFYGTDVWNRNNVRDVLMAAHDGFVFVSERSRDLWVEEAGLHDVPVYVLPNTCAEEAVIASDLVDRDRVEVASGLGLDPGEVSIVVVGTVQRLKGQIDVIDAVRRLREKRREVTLHVYFVGRVREQRYADELEALVSAHGLGGAVTFVGEVPKTRALEYVAAADALVIASQTEAMPLVLLEAMQLGTPIVTTLVGGIPEVVDGTCATTFDVRDVDALVSALEQLVDDPARSAVLARAAAARYRDEFSNEHFRRRFATVLGSLAVDSGLAAVPPPAGGFDDGLEVERRPDGVLVASGVAGSGRRWRAALAAHHAEDPLRRVELRLPGVGLLPSLETAAPLARLGLAVTEFASAVGTTVCATDAGQAVLAASDVLRIVGGPPHEAAYAEHVRASARRRAKARTLELAEAQATTAAPAAAPRTATVPRLSLASRVLGRLPRESRPTDGRR